MGQDLVHPYIQSTAVLCDKEESVFILQTCLHKQSINCHKYASVSGHKRKHCVETSRIYRK